MSSKILAIPFSPQGNGRELMLLPVQSIHQTFYTHSFIYSSWQTDEENETHGGYVTGPTLSICDPTPLLFLLYLIASQRDFFFFLPSTKCDAIHLSTLLFPMAISKEHWGQTPLHLLRTFGKGGNGG